MLAKDAEGEIVRNPNPLILPSSATVVQAARQMESQRVSAVLVTAGDADADVVGIFTGRDAVARVLARGRDPVKTPWPTPFRSTTSPGRSPPWRWPSTASLPRCRRR
jgi:hypothetical protein